ncbi:MAG TPA: hypothetical protein VNK82_07520 [Terriglobales bacterium]|nr:hypothetical protein [Terriglobales bacterium]
MRELLRARRKVRGFLGDRSGEADLKVIFLAAGESLPAGTVRWAAPPLGDKYVNKIVQSRKVDDATPDFFVEELPNSGGVRGVVRAFTADGQQKWVWPNDGRNIATAAADNSGGVLVFNTFTSDTQNYLSSVSKDGTETWRTATPSAVTTKYAVHPDGTVFVLQVPSGVNPAPAQVVALDPTNGQPSFTVTLPASSTTTSGIRNNYVNPTTGQSYTICDPLNSTTSNQVSRFGGLVIDGGGLLWVPVVANVTNRSVSCTPQVDNDGNAVPWDGSGTSYTYTSTVYLVSVTSGGASTTAQVNSITGSGTNWNAAMPKFSLRNAIIPDGTGGVLFAGVTPSAAEVIFGSSGVQYNSPVGSVGQMLLGENDTVFVAGAFSGVAALNLQTGSTVWQRVEAFDLVAAPVDGSLFVENGTLQRIDSVGQVGDLVAGSVTYASTHFGGNLWALSGGVGDVRTLAAALEVFDSDLIGDGRYRGGNKQSQSSPPTELAPLPTCGGDPDCAGPREAIYAALDALISKMRNDCVPCQSYVFDKVTDANNFPITQNHFADWLSSPRPGFYDGTRSTGKVVGNLEPWKWYNALLDGRTVDRHFALSPTTVAATCTGRPEGCGPLKTFFRPSAIDLSQGGVNDANLSLLFHEALHGSTGLTDIQLQQAFGCANQSGDNTYNITFYLQQFVSANPPQTIEACQ